VLIVNNFIVCNKMDTFARDLLQTVCGPKRREDKYDTEDPFLTEDESESEANFARRELDALLQQMAEDQAENQRYLRRILGVQQPEETQRPSPISNPGEPSRQTQRPPPISNPGEPSRQTQLPPSIRNPRKLIEIAHRNLEIYLRGGMEKDAFIAFLKEVKQNLAQGTQDNPRSLPVRKKSKRSPAAERYPSDPRRVEERQNPRPSPGAEGYRSDSRRYVRRQNFEFSPRDQGTSLNPTRDQRRQNFESSPRAQGTSLNPTPSEIIEISSDSASDSE
jgi:hypothetical protein